MICTSKICFAQAVAVIAIVAGLSVPMSVRADERVGRVRVESVLLRPSYFSQEKEGGEFSFEDSSVTIEWRKDQNFSALLKVGSILERGLSQIYSEDEPEDGLGFVEAYAQYSGVYGHVRAGLIPLNFGLNGMHEEYERIWPYSLLFENRIIGLRDYGASYFVTHNRFYTEFTVHNGELDAKPNDGNPWVTTRWGWLGERFNVQISGQTGRTVKESTATQGSQTIGGWDRTRNAQWRFVALSMAWRPKRSEINFQVVAGEAQQREEERTLALYQFDIIRYIGSNWGVGLRHDQYDPNTKAKDDRISEESAMIFTKSSDATSLLALSFTKVLEEDKQVPNDKLWLQWRLTPFVK